MRTQTVDEERCKSKKDAALQIGQPKGIPEGIQHLYHLCLAAGGLDLLGSR